MKFFLKKTFFLITLFVIVSSISISFFLVPRDARAQWVVSDPILETLAVPSTASNVVTGSATPVDSGTNLVNTMMSTADHVKNFLLDGLATAIARQIVQQLTAQTVKWINSGFKGNPAYVRNPESFFLSVGDNVAAQFLSSDTFTNSLCSPFSAKVRLALAQNYLNTTQPKYSCTLGKLVNNYDNFANNFSNGGWNSWFSVTQGSTNNPYGAYLGGVDSLSVKVGTQTTHYQNQLTQSKGFLSWETCSPAYSDSTGTTNGTTRTVCLQYGITNSTAGNSVDANGLPLSSSAQECVQSDVQVYQNGQWVSQGSVVKNIDASTNTQLASCPPGQQAQVNTPGSVISDQLSKVMGSTVDELNITNSINQIVGALMTQMVQQVIGGVGKGLSGLSQPSASSGNSVRSFIDQMVATQSPAGQTKGVICLDPPSDTYTSSCTKPDIAYLTNVACSNPPSDTYTAACVTPITKWVGQNIQPTQADLDNALTKSGIEQTITTSTPVPVDPGIKTIDQATDEANAAKGESSGTGSGVTPGPIISCNDHDYHNICPPGTTFSCPPISGAPVCTIDEVPSQ